MAKSDLKESGASLRGLAGAEKVLKRKFDEALDGAAKADQNLASLLLTTNCFGSLFGGEEKPKSAEY